MQVVKIAAAFITNAPADLLGPGFNLMKENHAAPAIVASNIGVLFDDF